MKGAFLILAGGILFTGVFIGGFVAGGLLVCAAEDAAKQPYTRNEARYSSYTGGDDIPEADR